MFVVIEPLQGSNIQTFKVELLSSILKVHSRKPSDESTIGTDELVPRTIQLSYELGSELYAQLIHGVISVSISSLT